MKISHLLTTGLIAVAAWLLPAPATHAAVATASGDLILAFRTNDNSVPFNLEIDLGAYTQFSSLSAGTVLNLGLGGAFYGANGGLAASDLSAVYGANWNSLANLVWSVGGTTTPTLFATFLSGITPTRKSTPAQTAVSGNYNTIRSTLNGSANTYINGSTTVNLAGPTTTALDSGLTGSYTGQIRGGGKTIDYNYFATSTETAVPSSGTADLTLWQLDTGSGPGSALGVFSLGSNGTFIFTAAPEPTSALLLGLGGLSFLARRRRPATV